MGQIIPPGYGPQVVVLVKPFPGFRFGVTLFLTHTHMRLSMVVVGTPLTCLLIVVQFC